MSDEQRVRNAVIREATGRVQPGQPPRVISHGTARTIASWFNDGADTVIYAFVSTGAMPNDHNADDLYSALLRGVDEGTRNSTPGLHALKRYLENRVRTGQTGPVDGWSDMWVQG